MLRRKFGFQVCVKKRAPNVKGIHCMIHHQKLASKTLPAPLKKVLDQTVQIVNFIKGEAQLVTFQAVMYWHG